IYVVLRCSSTPGGFVTESYREKRNADLEDSTGVAPHGASGSGVELHGTPEAGGEAVLSFVPEPLVERKCEASKDQPKDTPEPEDGTAPTRPPRRSVASPVAFGTMVGCLNWLALGCPSHDPAHAHIHGAALTDDQHNVLCTLERHCLHFVRAGFCCGCLDDGSFVQWVHASRGELLKLAAKWDKFKAAFWPRRVCPLLRMFSGFSAYNPVLHNGPCFIALNALAMGDCGAVEYAQQAHFNVLASLGNSMRPSEFVAYRRTFPRSECLEFLSIDDHMTAQVCSRMQLRSKAPLRDTEIFAAADTAYPLVGLVPHPGKRKRQVTSGTFLGADVDGCEGLVSAPRHRIGVLMRITSLVSRHGRCTPALLASILGLWVHILLFRRPVFSILGQVFADARRTPANRVFQLHRDSVNELACLCIMGPLIQADLRAGYPGKIFCMDASPTGAGICCATLPGPVVKELWRHTEQKGFYTKLLEPASALLQSLDLSDDPGAAFVEGLPATSAPFSPEPLPLRAPRSGGGSFLCLFGGDCNWVPAHTRAGLRDFGVERPELSALSFGDLEDRSTFSSLCTLALSGLVHDWHCHPPPASFCGACPDVRFSAVAGLRSCDSPAGLEPVSDELARDNTLARRLCFLLCLAASAGSFVSVSHPAESLLFRLHCFRGLVALGAVATQVSFCAFGSPCQCATTFLHNKPWLHQLGRTSGGCTCPASSPHFASAGRFTIASLAAFCDLCRPDVSAVLGRPPVVGELVSDFSRRYPLPLACRIASGSALACTGVTSAMPVSAFARQFFDDPEWISELSDCLDFKEALARGEFRLFDLVCASAAVPRLLGRWLRLLLLLAGDVERNPGPFHSGEPRGHLDMEGGFAVSTRHKMDKALSAFSVWLEATFSLSLAAVLSSAPAAAAALRTWGLYLYSSGQPRYLLVYAITGVQDCHPVFRSHLSPAWQVDRKWQQAEPGECRPVISQPILLAAVSLALCWGWCDWAAVTLVGFLCMLHPSEMICLVRADLVFPEDALSPDPVAYVHIRNPKTQRFARRQHSCLEDPLVLLLLEALYFNLPLPSRLFRGSMHVYRRQWNCIMARLGVPHRLSEKGATPGVLRGSGATFLYLEIEDLPLVAWRGRWSKTKTVEFYLQEVAAQLLLQRLPRWARDRIRLLSSFSRSLVLKVVQAAFLYFSAYGRIGISKIAQSAVMSSHEEGVLHLSDGALVASSEAPTRWEAGQPRADPDRVTPLTRADPSSSSTLPKTAGSCPQHPRIVEYFFDFKLEDKPELEAVNAFATLPAWSSKSYEGEVMPNQKRAKRSAAEKFKTDPLEQTRPARDCGKQTNMSTGPQWDPWDRRVRMRRLERVVPELALGLRRAFGGSRRTHSGKRGVAEVMAEDREEGVNADRQLAITAAGRGSCWPLALETLEQAAIGSGGWEGALRLLSSMRRRALAPDLECFNEVLPASSSSIDREGPKQRGVASVLGPETCCGEGGASAGAWEVCTSTLQVRLGMRGDLRTLSCFASFCCDARQQASCDF
ncbi:unnamed protein product, partial [Symbiodinium microadriaticum]